MLYFILYLTNVGQFRVKFRVMTRRISYKKLGKLIFQVLAVITFLYLSGGAEFELEHIYTFLVLFIGVLILISFSILSNVSEKYKLDDLIDKEIRKEKLLKIKRSSLIYRIKTIFDEKI